MKRVIPYLEFVVLTSLFYLQISYFQSVLFGVLFGIFSLFALSTFWEKVFNEYFHEDEGVVKHMLSFFTPVVLLGFAVALPVTWFHLSNTILSLCYATVFVVSFEVSLQFKKIEQNEETYPLLGSPGLSPALYCVLYVLTFLGVLNPGSALGYTPWHFLPAFYLTLFFLLTLVLGFVLLSHVRTRVALFFLLLHALLLHLYVPMSHEMPFGGDVWRTIAVEEKLKSGGTEYPVLFGEGVKWKDFGSVSLPEAITIPNKYFYSHLWGSSVFFSTLLSVDLIQINRFLVPIVWSLTVPILLFALGKRLFETDKKALFFSFFSFLPFSLQALGSLTLSVSWGFIQFLFLLLLFVTFLQNKNKGLRNFTLILEAFSLFGYPLFFLLFWFVVGVSWFLQLFKKEKIQNSVWVFISIFSIILFPVLELAARFDTLPKHFSLLNSLKTFLFQWSGWQYVQAPSKTEVASANVIFNHTPASAFVQNIFTVNRFHIMLLMAVIGFFVACAFVFLKKEKKLEWKVLTTLFVCIGGGYILGWYVLEGERFFIRRFDAILALLIITFFCYGFFHFFPKYKHQSPKLIFLSLVFLSASLTTVYASGPDLRVVSTDEYLMAKKIESEIGGEKPCVLADTWLLLALEGVSKGKIVGGGFPMDTTFGQKERVKLLEEVQKVQFFELVPKMQELTGAKTCFLAIPKNSDNLAQIKEVFGNFVFQNETVAVWKIGLKKNAQ